MSSDSCTAQRRPHEKERSSTLPIARFAHSFARRKVDQSLLQHGRSSSRLPLPHPRPLRPNVQTLARLRLPRPRPPSLMHHIRESHLVHTRDRDLAHVRWTNGLRSVELGSQAVYPRRQAYTDDGERIRDAEQPRPVCGFLRRLSGAVGGGSP
jgi:hypothetical protein